MVEIGGHGRCFHCLLSSFERTEATEKKNTFQMSRNLIQKVQCIIEEGGLLVNVSGLYMRGNGFESEQGYQITSSLLG
jgi:hypothetical protein